MGLGLGLGLGIGYGVLKEEKNWALELRMTV